MRPATDHRSSCATERHSHAPLVRSRGARSDSSALCFGETARGGAIAISPCVAHEIRPTGTLPEGHSIGRYQPPWPGAKRLLLGQTGEAATMRNDRRTRVRPASPPTVERQERRIGGSGRLQPRGVGPGAAGRRSGQNKGQDPGSAREAVSVDSSTLQQDSCGERAERCPASGLSPAGEVIRDSPGRISLPGSAIVRFENSLPRTSSQNRSAASTESRSDFASVRREGCPRPGLPDSAIVDHIGSAAVFRHSQS